LISIPCQRVSRESYPSLLDIKVAQIDTFLSF